MRPIFLSLLCLLPAACNSPSADKTEKPKAVEPDAGAKPVALGKDALELAGESNQFAFDLYALLGQKEGNVFFSPYSISTALGMTYAGARGNTAKQMAQTLHFTLDNERLHPAFGELIHSIDGAGRKRSYQLDVANSLWGDKRLSLDPKFLRITQTDYRAGFQFVDFVGDTEGARKRINGWVEDKTNKKIEELFPEGIIKSTTGLVLANAIYFKGDWAVQFPKAATRPEDFTVPGKPAFKVPMMNHHMLPARYTANEDYQLAELMYKGDEISMVVILPKKKDGLREVEKKLSAKTVTQALAIAGSVELQVALPKFKMTQAFSLAEDLSKLGMKDAFTPGAADFSGMAPHDELFISAVVHKAFVEVDEKGTEAAAATGVAMSFNSAPPPPPLFRADHPFLFVLRHNATGSILFLGRVHDPRN